jgi:hypothetical protein
MQSMAISAPLVPSKTDIAREAMYSCMHGERKAAYQASRQRLGIAREAVWIQPTPAGDVAVFYLEADNLQAAFNGLATSTDPFDTWFRELTREIHGIDLEGGLRPPEQTVDYRRDADTAVLAPTAGAGTAD